MGHLITLTTLFSLLSFNLVPDAMAAKAAANTTSDRDASKARTFSNGAIQVTKTKNKAKSQSQTVSGTKGVAVDGSASISVDMSSVMEVALKLQCDVIKEKLLSDSVETTLKSTTVDETCSPEQVAAHACVAGIITTVKSYKDKPIGKGLCGCASDKYAWIYNGFADDGHFTEQYNGCSDSVGDGITRNTGFNSGNTPISLYGWAKGVANEDGAFMRQVCECWQEYQEKVLKEQFSGECGCPKGYSAQVVLGASDSKVVQCTNSKNLTNDYVITRKDGAETSWEAAGISSSDGAFKVVTKDGKYYYSVDTSACLETTLGIDFTNTNLSGPAKFTKNHDSTHCYVNGYEVKAQYLNNCNRQAGRTFCGGDSPELPCVTSP